MFKPISRLVRRWRWLWRLSADRAGRLAAAERLLDEIGEEAITALLREPALVKPDDEPVGVRDLLASVAQDVAITTTPSDKDALAELAASASRVREEAYWKEYLGAVTRLHAEMLDQWRRGLLTDDAAKGLSWVLESLPKLTGVIDALHKKVEIAEESERRRQHWREDAKRRRERHGRRWTAAGVDGRDGSRTVR